ncbi:ThiF family adenylyltransferase [Paenibacillus sp. LS1]|uniref:ThiF family adenylyltransferase n=1 Tax=Paenibacillus sp. LS1 TaxID=2992120 RepID=UPI0022302747|nr:E2/UBC family protein [Paenibacillus sp. LS1]MCW3794471.1 ThiF family adenylyltransferase [Paenibacillus sp. LS1]
MGILETTIEYIRAYGQDEVTALKRVNEFEESDYRYASNVFEIETMILDAPFTLVVALPEYFPSCLPSFFDHHKQSGFIPHVEKDGFICFTQNENMVIDERFPGAIVLECLKKVKSVLEEGIKGENKNDFLEEFEVYWSRVKPYFSAICMLDDSKKKTREIAVYKKPNSIGASIILISEVNHNPKDYVHAIFNGDVEGIETQRGIFVSLEMGSQVPPPETDKPWTLDDFQDYIIPQLSKENKSRLFRLLHRTPKAELREEFIVISIPIDDKRTSMFGVHLSINYPSVITKSTAGKTFPAHLTQSTFRSFNISRHNQKYMLQRTGGHSTYNSKHAVIIGVGAVGSPVAVGLAKSGFNKLTLIDYDFLDADNVYRHELGVNRLYHKRDSSYHYQTKVWAMHNEIKARYPFTEVFPIVRDIRAILSEMDWERIDLIVVCIGAPNTEMMINQFLKKIKHPPPVIHAWLEPLGIGGHVLVTNNGQKEGCYKCLFRPISDHVPISNLSSFAEPNQSFTISLTGCGSYFTPYNFLDSEQTANLVLRTAHKVLDGTLAGNPILSWKGEDNLFLKNHYRVSARYRMSEDMLYEKRFEYIDPHCPHCSDGVKHD